MTKSTVARSAKQRKPKNLAGNNGIVVQLQPRFDFIEVFDTQLYPKGARLFSKATY